MKRISMAVIFFAAMCMAADVPLSPAKVKYDASVKAARDIFNKSLLAADQEYIAELDGAIKAAMTGGPAKLEDVKKLDREKTGAEAAMARHQAETSPSFEWLDGTKWVGKMNPMYKFDGKGGIAGTGVSPGHWTPIDANSISVTFGTSRMIVTFTADHLSSVWESPLANTGNVYSECVYRVEK